MNPHLQRAELLFQQSRWELAENELRQALAQEPEVAGTYSLLALCQAEREQFPAAQAAAEKAIGLAPQAAFSHYALARVLSLRHETDQALAAIRESIRLDPTDADFHSIEAALLFDQKRWSDALRSAETGLQFDPEHISANNLRAMALVKLGRKAEAGATLSSALARNPDNADTHANQGWALLEQGQPQMALEHFREALRLDPTNDWARSGIVEALQAGNPIYAFMLRYFLWMQKFSANAQWGLILGAWMGSRLLGSLAEKNPEWAPWIQPIRFLYLAFCLMTWLAQPLFNLLLRFHRFGRYALSEDQIQGANWVGACLGSGIIAALAGLILGFPAALLILTFVCFGLSLPVAAIFKCSPGWPRQVMQGVCALLVLLGFGAAGAATLSADLASLLGGGFLIGFVASLLGANLLMTQRPKR